MKSGTRLNLILALLIAACTCNAQQSPTVSGATVRANVSASTGLFTYSYVVTNSSSSTGSIWSIDIDISKPAGSLNLNSNGLINDPVSEMLSKALEQDPKAVAIVPVAFQSLQGWTAGPSSRGTAGWAGDVEAVFVRPGQSVSGLQLTSPGLPGIRQFVVEPYLDVDTLPVAPPDGPGDLKRYVDQVNALKAVASVKGFTIGPTAPPEQFAAREFLKTIQSYKELALGHAWITNIGIANSLDAKLNAALQSLGRGDTTSAKNQLNALLNEVNAQAGNQITMEAVALLKFNTEYLLSKLP